ncbi:zinc finger protein OZF-like isoform X1 [Dermacentor silvarum]|uniref:zinc finger protein OZF-like isoform X1 n=2 Tax=Dermacentor silvarum TaxID=543639 RepID=UPI002100FFBF|nr:zinc finger protein OZF-like isoform X1 [Dermacentor silvarum]
MQPPWIVTQESLMVPSQPQRSRVPRQCTLAGSDTHAPRAGRGSCGGKVSSNISVPTRGHLGMDGKELFQTAVLLPEIVSVTTLTDSTETSVDAAIKDNDLGIPDGTITTSAMQCGKATGAKKFYECNVCGRYFNQKTSVDRHQATHTGEKPHPCPMCDRRFAQKSQLVNHLPVHTGEKRHACSTCGERFVRRRSLVVHERTHTGEQPHRCIYCSATFARSDTLNNHMLRHTGERPYECDVCGKRFTVKPTLVRHRRIHRSDRYYMCEQCPAAFCQKESLTRHMPLHECGVDAYHCPICKRAFSHSPNLTLHMRVMHNGGRPVEMAIDCKATLSPPSGHSSTLLPVNIKTEDCGDLSNMDELITGDVYL